MDTLAPALRHPQTRLTPPLATDLGSPIKVSGDGLVFTVVGAGKRGAQAYGGEAIADLAEVEVRGAQRLEWLDDDGSGQCHRFMVTAIRAPRFCRESPRPEPIRLVMDRTGPLGTSTGDCRRLHGRPKHPGLS